MERAGFVVTVIAGFLSCVLLAWQGFEGVRADWVSGFLCVLWSLLMMARLMILSAPNTVPQRPHLAQKIIHSLYQKHEDRRSVILQQSFNTSFAVFLMAGFLLCAWQIVFSSFQSGHAGPLLAPEMQQFFAANDQSAFFNAPRLFDWGQGFSYLLSLSMMGFLLRSYTADIAAVRPVLLIFAGYIAAGLLLFFGLTQQWELPQNIAFFGYEGRSINESAMLLIDGIMMEGGMLALLLVSILCCVPAVYIWLSLETSRRDWVVIICGSLAVIGLGGSLFVGLHPALGGFIFLCWMGAFLAWGASERPLATLPA